jgi:hypothetical protein
VILHVQAVSLGRFLVHADDEQHGCELSAAELQELLALLLPPPAKQGEGKC